MCRSLHLRHQELLGSCSALAPFLFHQAVGRLGILGTHYGVPCRAKRRGRPPRMLAPDP